MAHTETAVFELRDLEHAVENARRARDREIEVAIRTVREHRRNKIRRAIARARTAK